MKLLLLGAPGSGKGTVSYKLVNENGFKHISTGNLFREILEEESELAMEVRNYLYNGELVPDQLTNKILKNAIDNDIKKNISLVFDGYPRNIDQAKFLSHICKIDLVVLLEIDEKIVVERITQRRICPTCGTIYNIKKDQLKSNNLCSKDNTILIQRKDDNIETIKNRMKVYNETAKELIQFYDKQKVVLRIDANQSAKTVNQLIIAAIQSWKSDYH